MTTHSPRFASITRLLPSLAAVAMLLAIAGAALAQMFSSTGELIYPIDDAYIHMAMARNLALHGVYGVTPFETTHASSSPLWVLALAAGFALIGAWEWWPLLLTAASAIAIVAIASKYLQTQSTSDEKFRDFVGRGFVLCLVVAGASLPSLVLQGMEHPLQAALLLLAAWLGATAIAEPQLRRSRAVALVLLCLLLPMLRYESLWLTALLAGGLAWRRRGGLAGMVALASAASVCAVGFWAVSEGLSFLPAPILTKSVGPFLMSDNSIVRLGAKLVWHPIWRLGNVPLLMMLFATGAAYLGIMIWRLRLAVLDQIRVVMVALFVGGTWIHATFATFGWGSRYEAYLIVLGTTALGAVALDLPQRLRGGLRGHRIAGLLSGFAVALTIYAAIGRVQLTYANLLQAAPQVLNRDFYIARFLAEAYPRQSVMAMNIGAATWVGEPRLLDPVALGSPQILPLVLDRRLNVATLDAIARERGVLVFVVFDEWFGEWVGGPPPWTRVAEIDASSAKRRMLINVYARDAAEGRILAERLTTIRPEGHFGVRVKILPPFAPR